MRHASLRRIVTAAAAVIALGAVTLALPGTAEARWHGGGWHGGWHGYGGWGFAIGFGAPYQGGYYGGPYYAYGDETASCSATG